MLTLYEVESIVIELANKINSSSDLLPTFGYNKDFARPEVRIDSLGYHYVVIERGEEFEHLVTQDIDKLLYQIFQSVTFEMAIDYEVNHRKEYLDSRRIAFDKQIELLKEINIEFADRRQEEIKEILKRSPFDDPSSLKDIIIRFWNRKRKAT